MTERIHEYELLDFGAGRKLERFGEIVVDRPCPAAEGVAIARPVLWHGPSARYEGARAGDGKWTPGAQQWAPADWTFTHFLPSDLPELRLELDALPSGQIGVFPEQRENWGWIARRVNQFKPPADDSRALRVLNLFAYTGGSTLAAAAAGAEVVHIDAAQNIVDRARANAKLSGLADRPIRWIAEDALRFCRREVKRGTKYDGVILDPPTYGHGPKGEVWKIEKDLLPLLRLCGELTSESRAFVLVTCHSPGIGPPDLAAYLSEGIFGNCSQPPAAGEMFLTTAAGRKLPSGVYARWPS
jgi:23S rRNA (cytosine1962-C5)-methyltransferase